MVMPAALCGSGDWARATAPDATGRDATAPDATGRDATAPDSTRRGATPHDAPRRDAKALGSASRDCAWPYLSWPREVPTAVPVNTQCRYARYRNNVPSTRPTPLAAILSASGEVNPSK